MMNNTTQPIDTCGVAYSLSLIGGKWKPLIIWHLLPGSLRLGALKRTMPAITERVLIVQLKELVRDGLVERTTYPVLPPKVEYRLTPFGESLRPLLLVLEQWGDEHKNYFADAGALNSLETADVI